MTDHFPGEWRLKAACYGHPTPDIWFADLRETGAVKSAKAICWDCPVRRACAADAVQEGERVAILGGYHTRSRKEWQLLQAEVHGRPVRDLSQRCTGCRREFRSNTYEQCRGCRNGWEEPAPLREIVEQVRLKTGHTRKEIAALAGLSVNTLSGLMHRDSRVSKATADRIKALRDQEVLA